MTFVSRAILRTRVAGGVKFSLIALCLAMAGVSCGKMGPPVPPTRFGARTTALAAVQRGGGIFLSWPAPALVADDSNRMYISRVDIYRLTEKRDEEPVLDLDDFEEQAEVVGSLDRAAVEQQISSGSTVQYTDSIDLSSRRLLADVRLRYAVRYVNKRGQEAAFSNTVAVEPVPGVAGPPTDVRVASEAQDAIVLQWQAPISNTDGSQPASIAGYNVYRYAVARPGAKAQLREPINTEPLQETTFADRQFRYQLEYVYIVRTVSPGANGLVESADSELVRFTAIDRFAPNPPEPVTIASANVIISLFWPSSQERDVVGYNVYRAESDATDEKDWSKLNPQPATAVTFHDDRVITGKRYYYRITAIDRFGNESLPSRTVAETANP